MSNFIQNIILLFLGLFLTTVVFFVDYFAPDDIATGVTYCVVIFYSWLLSGKNATIITAFFCSTLLILAAIYSNSSVDISTDTKMLNIVFSILAIWICALLVKIAKRSFNTIENSNEILEKTVDSRTFELEKKKQELKESELIYRYLYEQSNEMHLSLDAKKLTILQCNQTLSVRINKSKSEILNSDISQILDADSHRKLKEKISNNTPVFIKELKVKLLLKGEDSINAVMNASLVENEDKSKYYRVSLIDITDQIKSAQLLSQQNDLLLEKNKELEQFAYITSHDLQEPLRTITSFIGLIGEKYSDLFDESGKAYMDRIHVANMRMKNLILVLLEYSRLGKDSKEEKLKLTLFFQAIIEDFQEAINVKNANIKVGDLPNILGRPTELRLLFQNLISNSLKFTKEGAEVTIEIGSIISEKEVKIFVRDNGIGIEEKFQDRIFLIFQRLHTREEYEGTGIGLAQAEKIATLHNGRIELESELDKGSIFTLTLPLNRIIN